jgi:hypothetical protein
MTVREWAEQNGRKPRPQPVLPRVSSFLDRIVEARQEGCSWATIAAWLEETEGIRMSPHTLMCALNREGVR